MRLWDRLRGSHATPTPDSDASAAAHAPPAVAVGTGAAVAAEPVVVRRWVQLVLLPLALLGLYGLARAAGTLFLVLIIACLVALILAPAVRLLTRVLPRGIAILLVYLLGFAIVIGIGVLLAQPVTSQISHFESNLPSITRHANHELDQLQSSLDRDGINIHIKTQGHSAISSLEKTVLKRSGDIVSFSRGLLTTVVSIGIDLVLILVLSIYLLVYGRQIGTLVRAIMPSGDGTTADDYPRLIQHAVSSYVRGQLLFSLVMGASEAILLEIFGLVGLFPAGRHYAIFFGVFYGLMEFIPYVGPIVGPIPALLVALFQHPISAVWLLIAFLALQQLEGHIVAPQLFKLSLRINPILIILALLVGDKLYGIPGALVALPVIAVIRETWVYLRGHTVLESWGPPVPPVLGPPPEDPGG